MHKPIVRPTPLRLPSMALSKQRGAALITALLVVSLAAVLVSGLLWRQQVEIRRIDNQRQLLQARWLSRAAIDWTRLILRTEADTEPVTYLGGVWNVPIAPTRLSDVLGRIGDPHADEGGQTWLSGQIEDPQAKFNLRNLVANKVGGFAIDPLALAQLQKLLSLLGLNVETAQPIAARVRASLALSATRTQRPQTSNPASMAQATAANSSGAPDDDSGDAASSGDGEASNGDNAPQGLSGNGDGARQLPLQMHSLDALLDVPGVTPAFIARLQTFATILPVPTPLNLNSAGPEVISAAIPALSLSAAQGFVRSREQAYFVNLGDAQTRMARFMPNSSSTSLDEANFDVSTHFFAIHERIQHDRAVVDRIALIYRDPRTHSTHIIQVSDAATD